MKKFVGHISTCCKFWLHMLKKWNIFENFATSKKLFFANIYQSQSKSYEVLKIEGPLRTTEYEINKRGDSKWMQY